MSGPQSKFVFVVSTSGSVMNQVLSIPAVRRATHSVIADQACAGVDKARAHGLTAKVFDGASNEAFCARLVDYLAEHSIDYVISFYTQFYALALREQMRDRIINFHPSLLPAFKGMDGFGDGMAHHTKIIGTTVELIKDVMDEGKIVMQTATTVDPHVSHETMRHRIFIHQCKSLIQTVHWILEDRLTVRGDQVIILDAGYQDLEFVPALDATDALELQIPMPWID